MPRQHGSLGEVAIDPAGGTAYVAVASLNSWTLDAKRDRSDATAFLDTNKQYTQGLPDYNGTYGGWWDPTTTPDQIFDVVFGTIPVGLRLKPSTLTPTAFFSGLAYLDGGIEVKSDGTIAIKGSWAAAGNWTLAP